MLYDVCHSRKSDSLLSPDVRMSWGRCYESVSARIYMRIGATKEKRIYKT
jgi:hypothetical protein